MPNGSRAGAMRHSRFAKVAFEDMLVFFDGTPAAQNALSYAEELAPEGNITALQVSIMPTFFAGDVSGDAWAMAQEQAEREAQETESALKAILQRKGSRAELRRAKAMADDDGRVIAGQTRYVDGAIFGWPHAQAERPVNEFEGVLFHSGRPALIVPEKCSLRGSPRSIMIAWSATREASRAVHDALPLLAAAEFVRVVVVADDWSEREQNPGDDMARHLARHDVKVEVKHVATDGKPVAEILLDEARFQGAELLVMGGYGHSRTGEWLLGGVTREILHRPTVPLFLSH